MASIGFAFFLIVLALLRNHGEETALRRIECGGPITLPSYLVIRKACLVDLFPLVLLQRGLALLPMQNFCRSVIAHSDKPSEESEEETRIVRLLVHLRYQFLKCLSALVNLFGKES
jgi:hypothetical protein